MTTVDSALGAAGPVARLDRLLAQPARMRPLEQLRIAVGVITVVHLWPFLTDGLAGRTYHDTFHHPYVGWYPELSPPAYTTLLIAGVIAAAAMSIGLASRVATSTAFAVVAYNLLLSTTHYHNNRAYLAIVLGVLACAPLGHELSLDAWLRRRGGGTARSTTAPGWTIWLLRFECATVYAASGISKLLDPDWFGGTVTWLRAVADESQIRAAWVPDWYGDLVLERSTHIVVAKVIIATELFIAIGLWSRRTRPVAVVVAVVFHLSIQFSASVEIFSYLAIAVLLVWQDVDPRPRAGAERTPRPLLHHGRPAADDSDGSMSTTT